MVPSRGSIIHWYSLPACLPLSGYQTLKLLSWDILKDAEASTGSHWAHNARHVTKLNPVAYPISFQLRKDDSSVLPRKLYLFLDFHVIDHQARSS